MLVWQNAPSDMLCSVSFAVHVPLLVPVHRPLLFHSQNFIRWSNALCLSKYLTCIIMSAIIVWQGNTVLHGSHNAARRLLDGINYVSGSIAGVSAKPTKMVSDWVTDQIAPAYWVPNAEIKVCSEVLLSFLCLGTRWRCGTMMFCSKGPFKGATSVSASKCIFQHTRPFSFENSWLQ